MVGKALQWARTYYPQDKFYHACRVAEFVMANDAILSHVKEQCYIVALLHDLLEDTDFDIKLVEEAEICYYSGGCTQHISKALLQLTHDKEKDSYEEYIAKIPKGSIAYWVKIADMKDHLTQTATLTDKLKEKYLRGLAILL